MYNVKTSFINQTNMNNLVSQHHINPHSFKNLHFIAPLHLSWARMQQQMKEQCHIFNKLSLKWIQKIKSPKIKQHQWSNKIRSSTRSSNDSTQTPNATTKLELKNMWIHRQDFVAHQNSMDAMEKGSKALVESINWIYSINL